MKTISKATITLVTIIAMAATETTDARSYGSVLGPRAYQYSRPRDPFDLISDFFRAPIYFNSLMKQQQDEAHRLARSSSPRYAVYEHKDTGMIELEMEVPGVSARDLDIELENDRILHIKGTRRNTFCDTSSEESEFKMSFQLADGIDSTRLSLTLENGILRVTAPKKEKVVRKLQVSNIVEESEVLAVNDVDEARKETTDKTFTLVDSDDVKIIEDN